jgi:hypothetical protein
MSIEDKDELAQEFAEFGYRETFDPNDADRRNFYKVEKVGRGRVARRSAHTRLERPGVCKSDLRHRKEAPTARSLYITPRHPRPRALAAPCAALIAARYGCPARTSLSGGRYRTRTRLFSLPRAESSSSRPAISLEGGAFFFGKGGATVLPRPQHFQSPLTLAKAAQSVSAA